MGKALNTTIPIMHLASISLLDPPSLVKAHLVQTPHPHLLKQAFHLYSNPDDITCFIFAAFIKLPSRFTENVIQQLRNNATNRK